jgi:hypothetical protein
LRCDFISEEELSLPILGIGWTNLPQTSEFIASPATCNRDIHPSVCHFWCVYVLDQKLFCLPVDAELFFHRMGVLPS